ncbi:hypothetical protein ACIQWR_07905 [Streptomyces sp. NPDC098789]|uniref:hypothetical protein n=1 Tax=Streptomyces sp. NPDC098789 TaxID=3366098 RepID=UPI0038112284
MQLRRVLPLSLAALLLGAGTTGCTTVAPAAPAARTPVPVNVRTPSPRAVLPLGRLPEDPARAAAPPTPGPPGTAEAAAADREEAPDADGTRRSAPRRSGTVRAPAPAKARTPRARPRPQARPAPGRAYDMSALCAAANGTVSPSIAQLCAEQYGR